MKLLKEYIQNREIGDWAFPLEVDLEKDLNTEHDHVHKEGKINDYANEVLESQRGKQVEITGVYEKFNQIVGYEARILDTESTVFAPKKDFFIEANYVEDVHADSYKSQQIRTVLQHFQSQHDYYGTSWKGIQLFHYELAKVAEQVGIESAGWYKYDTSTRSDMDGKDWRLVVPNMNSPVAVNCHSILHDDVWTMNTTVYSTDDLDFSKFGRTFGSADHWQRTYDWTIEVADILQTSGYDYSDVIEKFKRRKVQSAFMTKTGHDLIPEVAEAYRAVTGNEINNLPYVSIGLSNIHLPPGKVGHHRGTTDVTDYSIIDVNPEALKRGKDYVKIVIKHELIHYMLSQANNPTHDETFVKIGKELGIPDKFLD